MKYPLPVFVTLLVFAGGTTMVHHAFKRTVTNPPGAFLFGERRF
jgi:hypothetical protein